MGVHTGKSFVNGRWAKGSKDPRKFAAQTDKVATGEPTVSSKNLAQWTYFQYIKQAGHPIFARIPRSESSGSGGRELLEHLGFSTLSPQEFETQIQTFPHRLLTIAEASPRVAKYLGHYSASDRLQAEHIARHNSYYLYRFQGHGAMVYSPTCANWELGVHPDFGSPSSRSNDCIVVNRFLALALAPWGICGFWGVCAEGQAIIMERFQALGGALFIDPQKSCLLTPQGQEPLRSSFAFIRQAWADGPRKMSQVELLGFLCTHNALLDGPASLTPVNRAIGKLCASYPGQVRPTRALCPRTKSNGHLTPLTLYWFCYGGSRSAPWQCA